MLSRRNTLSYIAGFFDGEGSIYISGSKRQLFLGISITNTDLSVLQYIQKIIGGKISKSPDSRENTKKLFRLRLYSQEAKQILIELLPFLHTKKQQAYLVIEFQNDICRGKSTLTFTQKMKYKKQLKEMKK